jgi:crotonobetaine/carnitine-CoA ligase
VSDISTILYTSGTEGSSKGVLCPHGHAFQTSASHAFESGPSDVYLVIVPLFHAGGLFGGVFCALRAGGTAVIQRQFSATGFWDTVREYGVTQTFLLGAMADFIWRRDPTPEDTSHTLRDVTMVPAIPHLKEFTDRFGLNITSSYGQTETGTVMMTDPGEARPFLCGRPREFMQVRLVNDNDVEVEPGATGEILVRSSEPWTMMSGYHRMPEATVHAWRNLWLHTGDSAYLDDQGRYVYVDRKRDALRRRGENVSSLEVEKHITARDDIAHAAIVAVPSEHTEDDIKAVVVLRPGAPFDPAAMLRDLAARLPYFMVPRYYQAIDALPMTPTFKVRKGELRAQGITEDTWDCQAAGFTVTRHGLAEPVPAPAR